LRSEFVVIASVAELDRLPGPECKTERVALVVAELDLQSIAGAQSLQACGVRQRFRMTAEEDRWIHTLEPLGGLPSPDERFGPVFPDVAELPLETRDELV
jgi:hypothetical protein